MARKLSIRVSDKPAVTIRRSALRAEKLVYVATASKPIRYKFGRSPIVYIGTTSAGIDRIASSAAIKARELLGEHGIRHLDFHVVACRPLQKVKSWRKLESALLIAFREKYGVVPVGNTKGKNQRWRDEKRYFTESRLKSVLESFEE